MPGQGYSALDLGIQVLHPDSTTIDDIAPPVVRKFYNDSGAAIPANKAVSWDLSKSPPGTRIRQFSGTAATDGGQIIGITPKEIPDDSWGDVVVRGRVECEVADDVAAGDQLIGGADAGRLAEQSATYAAHYRVVAIALTAEDGNVADVYFLPGTII